MVWLGLGVAAPGRARADPEATPETMSMGAEARAHYDRGLALYADKDYAAAVRELGDGYALEPRREFLFAQAQALRLSGDCKSAVPLYQRFLATEPDDVQTNATHIALGRCAAQMATAAPTPVPPPDAKRAAPPTITAPAPPRPPPPREPWHHDLAGGALLGAGVVGLGTGAVFILAARAARDDANHASPSLPDYQAHWDTARGRAQVAIVAFAAGTALVAAAIVRYVRVRARPPLAPPPRLDAWLAPSARGGVAGLGGRF
jgi:hypothetical protein